ncbi:MAG: TolC family protein [Ignavibacteria bacterium]|nr:TolC family protein [Ignavibacteria bacterium]
MKININILSAFALILSLLQTGVYSQSNIDNVLKEISKNNKSIIANTQLQESRKLEYQTGQSLYNPFVEVTNLFGQSGDNGSQLEFKLIQSFDFPTSYSKRNKVSGLKIQQTDFEKQIMRREILLEAKLTCIELICLNKKKIQMLKRVETAGSLLNLYQTKLEKGEGNILDVNKSKINLLNLKTDLVLIENEIEELNEKLTGLNAGNIIVFADTSYPVTQVIPQFEILENEIEISDPSIKSLQQEKLISQSQVELSKSLSLPKFEVGYYYLGLRDTKYNGIHFGISIPLWENNYRTDYHRSKTLYSNLEIEAHLNDHLYEIKKLYGKYETLKEAMTGYRETLVSSDNVDILNKALIAGEITSINYFLEAQYLYTSFDKFLELEKEYNIIIAELYKHKL